MKEMISEEDGSMSGASDVEKNHKRVREQNNRDDDTAKRIKVETLPEFEDIDDEVIDSADCQNMDALRGDSEAEENEDSLSEINENSDVSQNSISSSNNNNLDRRKNNMETLEDGQEEDRSESPCAPVLVAETAQSKDESIVENGRHVPRIGSSTNSGAKRCSVEMNEDSSGGSSKENIKQETVLQRFEKEISDLTTLLLLKEKEWNAVLRLVKLKEIALAQLQRRKDVDEILESTIPSDSGSDYMQKLFKQIVGETIQTGASETHVRNSIIETEKEVIELGKQISSSRIHNTAGKSIETDTLSGSDSSQVDSFFLASNALKSLVNRNKATLMSHSIPNASSALTASIIPSKVIGEGRQGPIVEVTSLIADYRSRAQSDSSSDKKSSVKQPSTPGSAPTFTPMNQSATISFTDVLTRLKKLSDKEKDSTCSTATSTTSNNKTAPASKTKASGNTNSSNASGSGKSSVGTTLAKLLSSNNAGTGSRHIDDVTAFSNKSTSNNLTNSDKNLSLANLLASAKSRDDPQKKKVDNQTVPLCQGCNANKAQFVCAGCANQWYCSRECQVAAWDEHSEVCSG